MYMWTTSIQWWPKSVILPPLKSRYAEIAILAGQPVAVFDPAEEANPVQVRRFFGRPRPVPAWTNSRFSAYFPRTDRFPPVQQPRARRTSRGSYCFPLEIYSTELAFATLA